MAPIEATDANAQTIRDAFLGYASANETKLKGLDCLMANTALARAALDPESEKFVEAYLERLTKGLRNALENARRGRDVDAGADLNHLAAHFVNSVVGIQALLRARATPKPMYSARRGATSVLPER